MKVRSLPAAALVALLAVPALATAQAKKAPAAQTMAAPPARAGGPALSMSGLVGYETGDLDGIVLRVDGEMPIQKLSPQLWLSGVGSVGFSHLSESVFGFDTTANLLKVVPTARITLPVTPQFSLFGDAGLGLYYASVSVETPLGDVSDSSLGMMLRFGAGGFFQLNERMKLGAELQLDPMFGDYDDATFSILAALSYRL